MWYKRCPHPETAEVEFLPSEVVNACKVGHKHLDWNLDSAVSA